jgi:hypothetical protein
VKKCDLNIKKKLRNRKFVASSVNILIYSSPISPHNLFAAYIFTHIHIKHVKSRCFGLAIPKRNSCEDEISGEAVLIYGNINVTVTLAVTSENRPHVKCYD